MTLIKTGIIALALAASLGAVATSASAQTSRADRIAAREARAEAQVTQRPVQQRFAPIYNVQAIGTAPANPNECRTDDGYGRYDTCDH